MRALGTPGAAISFRELADEYFRKWKGKDISRVARVGWWVDRIGDEKLIDIDQDLIRRHLKAYSAGKAERGNGRGLTKGQTAKTSRTRSHATINRMKAALSALLKFAVNEGYLNTNPARSLSQKTEDSGRKRYLSTKEKDALLEACRASEWEKLYLLVLMALTTGARQGELLKLRWCDVDFSERTAHLKDTKTSDPRLLTIPPKTMEELKQFRQVNQLKYSG